MSVEDIINSNNARAADAAGQAGGMASYAFQQASNLLNLAQNKIKLPELPITSLQSPGTPPYDTPPVFEAYYDDPDRVSLPPALQSIFESALTTADAQLRNDLLASMQAFALDYCPDFEASEALLTQALVEWVDSDVVSMKDYQRLVTELENGVYNDRISAQQRVLSGRGNGFTIPQPAMAGAMALVEGLAIDAMAKARIAAWSEAFKTSWSVRQSAASLLQTLNTGLRGSILSYANILSGQQDASLRRGSALAEMASTEFKLEESRANTNASLGSTLIQSEARRFEAFLAEWKAAFDARVSIKQIEQANRQMDFTVAATPYEAEMKRNLAQATQIITAMQSILSSVTNIANSWTSMAQAALSATQGTASTSKQE